MPRFDIRSLKRPPKGLLNVPPPFDRVGYAVQAVMEGYSVVEAAEHYGCSRQAVYNRIKGVSKSSLADVYKRKAAK